MCRGKAVGRQRARRDLHPPGKVNTPLVRSPGSETVSAASPAVDVTTAAAESFATPRVEPDQIPRAVDRVLPTDTSGSRDVSDHTSPWPRHGNAPCIDAYLVYVDVHTKGFGAAFSSRRPDDGYRSPSPASSAAPKSGAVVAAERQDGGGGERLARPQHRRREAAAVR